MEKRISFYEFQSVKSVAKACEPIIKKREGVKEKIELLVEEYKNYDAQIKALQEGVCKVLGFTAEQLVQKVVEVGVDGKGNPTRKVKYVPTALVTWDDAAKQYVIKEPTEEVKEEEPSEPVDAAYAIQEAPEEVVEDIPEEQYEEEEVEEQPISQEDNSNYPFA